MAERIAPIRALDAVIKRLIPESKKFVKTPQIEWELMPPLTDVNGNLVDYAFYRTMIGDHLIDVYPFEVVVVDLDPANKERKMFLLSENPDVLTDAQTQEVKSQMHKLLSYYYSTQLAEDFEKEVQTAEAPWI